MKKKIFIAIGFVLGLVAVQTPFVGNLYFVMSDRSYRIPKESNIFSFHPTVLNQGSGEWWIYGEDGKNFYYMGDEKGPVVVSKEQAKRCSGFNPSNFQTWCH